MKLMDKLKAPAALPDGKSRLTYAVLATLFGGLGLHNFYAGNSEKAKVQLAIGLIGLCCCCQPLYLLVVLSGLLDVITITTNAILKAEVPQPVDTPVAPKKKDDAGQKPFPVKPVVIAAIVLLIGLSIVGGIVITVVSVTGGHVATSAVERAFDSATSYEKLLSVQNDSDNQEKPEHRTVSMPSKTDRSASDTKLTPDQKVARLMAQLKKILGNSVTVSAALATIQEKVDQLPDDYKTKCVLQEMMGMQDKIPGGVVPDLPDPNGKGALEKYLKTRGLDGIGGIMCMYHMLSDQEQASVADEVRKLMK